MKLIVSLGVLFAFLGCVCADAGPVRPNDSQSYVVIMSLDPAATYGGDIAGLPATKPVKGKKLNVHSAEVRNYRSFLRGRHDASLAAVNVPKSRKVHDYTVALNGYSAFLTPDEAEKIGRQPGVSRVVEDQIRQKSTDSAPDFLGLTAPMGPWNLQYDGEGIVVGIIDTGIWPEHPSFADDGTYSPPTVVLEDTPDNPACNFGNTAHNPADAPFTCNNKLIGARSMMYTYRAFIGAESYEFDSARDDDGHGSTVASIATGNEGVEASIYGVSRGMISGVAPRAQLIVYKALGDLGGFSSDLASAIDQAVADGVDVINYSVGGGASLSGADDIALLYAADAGVFVATSTGNGGPAPGSITGPASAPWVTAVGASTQSRFFAGMITLGDASTYHGASVTTGTDALPLVDAEFAGGDLCLPGTLDPGLVAGKIVLGRRGVIARADKSLAVYMAGGAGLILYNNSDEDTLYTDTHWVPTVHVDQSVGLAIKSYIATDPAPTAQITGNVTAVWEPAPSMGYFSSRGPNPAAEDIIKPDLTAPGVQILAANTPLPGPDMYPGELFQALSGTSLSSPMVAGLYALIKQANPDWSPAMAKSALMTTAYQDVVDNDRLTEAGPFEMGAGHIDPSNAIIGGFFDPGLVYDVGYFEYLGFLCDAAPEVFANPEATCAFLESIGIPTEAHNLNLASIGMAEVPGVCTVERTVTSTTNGNRQFEVSVDAPVGYSVTVQPSTFKLKKGESATYAVTFTNSGAPVGEWRCGSLTWTDKSGKYSVRSPIAVKGIPFGYPEELGASGSSGSLSFDVGFGYTGPYSAMAHGLELPTVVSGTVSQDPDQVFDKDDGYSIHISFSTSGTALLRIVMPPESTEPDADLDLYLYNEAGHLVAQSIKGGTDEFIEVMLPEDGTWHCYVHGWYTVGPDSPFSVSIWTVPLAAGTSLSLDSAPTSATSGQTGTINVSWTALGSGNYLGAVSHEGSSGLMGLTKIEVTVE